MAFYNTTLSQSLNDRYYKYSDLREIYRQRLGRLFFSGWSTTSSHVYGVDGPFTSIDGTYFTTPVAFNTYSASSPWPPFRTLSAASKHALALGLDYQLVAWGRNDYGQLGAGDTTHRSSPIQIGTNRWSSAVVGYRASAGITSSGTLFMWGDNTNGQLGQNDRAHRSSPVQVSGNWSNVSLSSSGSTAAINSNKLLFVWGNNANGILGLIDTTHRSSPVQLGTDSWSQVSMSAGHTIAIRSDGTLWSWGQNTYGQLGQNDRTHRSSPTQIGSDNNWSSCTAGLSRSAAIKSNGSLFMWGYNLAGALGQNDTIHRSSPVQVGTQTNWLNVTIGDSTFAVKTDGSVWGWGDGIYNGLTTGNKSSPVQVAASVGGVRCRSVEVSLGEDSNSYNLVFYLTE